MNRHCSRLALALRLRSHVKAQRESGSGLASLHKEKGESCDSPFGKLSLRLKDLASDRRIRGSSSRRRILTNHAGLVGVVVVRASRAGDGNGRNGVGVDTAGGVTGAGRIRKAVSALGAAGQNAVNQARSGRSGVVRRRSAEPDKLNVAVNPTL